MNKKPGLSKITETAHAIIIVAMLIATGITYIGIPIIRILDIIQIPNLADF